MQPITTLKEIVGGGGDEGSAMERTNPTSSPAFPCPVVCAVHSYRSCPSSPLQLFHLLTVAPN